MTQSIHLETVGAGPSLVLLHANGGDQRDFAAIEPRHAPVRDLLNVEDCGDAEHREIVVAKQSNHH